MLTFRHIIQNFIILLKQELLQFLFEYWLMNKKLLLAFFLLILLINKHCWAQESASVTETQPFVTNGLEIGYQINSTEVKTVGDKGDFNRCVVEFYVLNKRTSPQIIFYQGDGISKLSVSDELAEFQCLNATGAQNSAKAATILAEPCKVIGLVDKTDEGSDKSPPAKRVVQIGYWIKPGQKISTVEILLVPLNEQPKIEAYYMVNAKPVENTSTSAQANNQSNNSTPSVNLSGFLKIKNAANNTYINIQTGPPLSTSIDKPSWFSAQWKFIPVQGTSYYNIQNKWKGTFLDTDNGKLVVSTSGQANSTLWVLEKTQDANIFKIKNIQTGTYLLIDNKVLALSPSNNDANSSWALELPPN